MSRKTVEFKRKASQLRGWESGKKCVDDLIPNKVVKSEGRKRIFDGKQLTSGRATGKVGTRPMDDLKARRLREIL